jgi:2OG-Fe(II) oxygenase superfamily
MRVIDELFTVSECEDLIHRLSGYLDGPLIPAPTDVFELLADRLSAATGDAYAWYGPMLTFNDTTAGMHEHRDEPYMGGDHTLLVYLTSPEGGETIFEDGEVSPVAGRAVLFGIRDLHSARAVRSGTKLVAAMECGLKGSATASDHHDQK